MSCLICAIFLALIVIGSESRDLNFTESNASKNNQMSRSLQMNFFNDSVVLETQRATCSIITEEVVAKAEATASRILTGVCTSEEMFKALQNLEKNVLEKLEQVQEKMIAVIQSRLHPAIKAEKSKEKNSKLSPFKTIEYLFDEDIFKKYDYK